jgi:serine/threonine-protein kinase PpkA
MGKSSRWIGWGVGVVLGVGLLGLAANAEPDPAKVREAMKRYEQEEEQSKPKPLPPKRQPRPRPEPAVATPAPVEPARPTMSGPALVTIRGGCFQMGSPGSEAGHEADEQQHQVCVQDFALGPTEVTFGEFKRFVADSGYRTDAEKNAGGKEGCFALPTGGGKPDWQAGFTWRSPGYSQTDRQPVVCVSWNDAMAYTKWLSSETGQRYRLPTEAEWEYAARAGTTTARYWGNDPDQACQYANVADQTKGPNGISWNEKHECNDGYFYPAPVGSFESNGLGLNDMLGNVWEWTCSAYDKDYGGAEKECTKNSTGGPLAVRGGGWNYRPARVRSAYRGGGTPAFRDYFAGFRLARSL